MKYMLLVYADEHIMTQAERDDCYVKSAKLARDLHARGQYVDASPLQLTPTATSVRVRNDKRFVTDGPFAETREQLGGYYIVETRNLDEAIAIAEQIPAARWGTIEVRPILEIAGLPSE